MSAHIEIHQDPAYSELAGGFQPARRTGTPSRIAGGIRAGAPASTRNSLGCSVVVAPLGLSIASVTPYSWCWACGLEPQDVILSINEQPARSTDDLRRAILNPRANSVVLETTTPTGGCFRFCLPVPLGEPEMHCMGFLFEQDPAAGFHVVVGLLKNSIADRAGVIRGCCIRRIDGFPVHGRKESDLRKMIFGGYDDHCVLSIQLPGEVTLGEAHLVRTQAALHVEEGDDSEYCDGWSEKQFDVGQASSKCLGWIGSNPPHLAGSDTGESITGAWPTVPEPDNDPIDNKAMDSGPDSTAAFVAISEHLPGTYQGSDFHAAAKQALEEDGAIAGEIQAVESQAISEINAKYAVSLQHFKDQAKSAYDAIDSARQMWSQASDERQEMRSTHVALEAQIRFLESSVLKLSRQMDGMDSETSDSNTRLTP